MTYWFAAYSRPADAFVARDELMTRGVEVFLPFQRISERIQRPRSTQWVLRSTDKPLFGRYFFVRASEDRLTDIIHTRGVSGVITRREQPVKVPDRALQPIICLTDSMGQVVSAPNLKVSELFALKVGDSFKFNERSPFEGFVGTIESLAKLDDTGKVSVFIDLLGSVRSIEVNYDHVGRAISDPVTETGHYN